MFIRTHIPRGERGLWFREGDLVGVLGPGRHWNPSWLWHGGQDTVDRFTISQGRFEHKRLADLVREPQLREQLVVVDVPDGERAFVWLDGRLIDVLGPGLAAYWKDAGDLRVERHETADFRFEHKKLQAILGHAKAQLHLAGVVVDQDESALLYRDGRFVEVLGPGLHVFWKAAGRVTWKSVDRREQALDVSGQEMMSADKVSVRLNAVVSYVVVDAVRAVQASDDYKQSLYRAAQLAAREAVGGRTLDALLVEKDAVAESIRDAVAAKADAVGVRVTAAGLRDVILPGDMRELFNGVIAAQKRAEANLIERREETAAARSQANTARLLAENPALGRLRELELMKDVLAGTKITFVLGANGEGGPLVEQVRKLIAAD